MGGYQINTTTAHTVLPFFFLTRKKFCLCKNESKRGLSTQIINKLGSDWIHMAPERTGVRNL